MKTVEIDEDIFIDMLWDRVRDNPFGEYFDDEFWTEAFERLSELGWMKNPQYNSPEYIVDNIMINGDIAHKEDAENEWDLEGKSLEEYLEENGGEMVGDYAVLSWGL